MRRPAAEIALPEAASCRRRFDRAAETFASASFIHDEARRRLLERVDHLRVTADPAIDLGSALGQGARALTERFPAARIVALDRSTAMLGRAVAGRYARLAGEAERLPFRDGSIGLVFANLLLPWTLPEHLFAEARRVLAPSGLLLFSTLGPDSLKEIRRAWAAVDDAIHVHAFWDVQTLGDLAMRAGLEEPVLDVDRVKVSYASIDGLVADLRASGGVNTAAGRRRGLTGPARWRRFAEALAAAQSAGRLAITLELIFGQAWGSRREAARASPGEIVVPIDQLKRKS
jgi:malonyl-CoA O-methyltransferase